MRGLVAIAIALSIGCSGARGSFDGHVYRGENGRIAFSVPPVPAGWRRIDVNDGSLAFRDDPHDASVLLNARCLASDERTPLVALTNHLLMGATERKVRSQQIEAFDGREALHTTLDAKWDGVPMVLDVFVLSKDGCVYDFVYVAAPRSFDDGAGVFERFVRGFRTLEGSGVVS